MPNTISIVCDFNHLIHPLSLPKKAGPPGVLRRISGAALLILSIPFTLGILTGFYLYWAHKKVVRIKKEQTQAIDATAQKLFGKQVIPGAQSNEQFTRTAGSLYKGDVAKAFEKMKELKTNDLLTKEAKMALIEAAIERNKVDLIGSILNEFDEITFVPLHKARSGAMVQELIANGVDPQIVVDDHGNNSWHYCANLEVAKALKDVGTGIVLNADGHSPLHTCQDPEVAKFLISLIDINLHNKNIPPPIYTVPLNVKKVLIEEGADLSIPYSFDTGETLLHRCEDQKLAEWLLDRKLDINSRDSSGQTPLFTVQNPKVLQFLIDKGADVSARNTNGKTILHTRSLSKPLISQVLAKAKGLIESKDNYGRTPLLANDSEEMKMLLIDIGADTKAVDLFQNTPLHLCNSKALAELLIQKGVEVNARNKKGNTPLHCAQTVELATYLLDKGAEINTQNSRGKSPLLAVHEYEVQKLLIDRNADINIKDSKGRGILHFAVLQRKPEWIRLLIEKGADPDDVDKEGDTPLIHLLKQSAILSSETEKIIEVLVEVSDLKKANNNQLTALHYLLNLENNGTLLTLFLNKGADPHILDRNKNTLFFYCKDKNSAEVLVNKWVNPKILNHIGQNPLFFASSDILAEFLVNTCGVDINQRDVRKRTPIHTCRSYSAISWLIREAKLDPNSQDDQQQTPLHVHSAVPGSNEALNIVNELIANKALVNAVDSRGRTPLHLCTSQSIAACLIKNGADIEAKDGAGKTPKVLELWPTLREIKSDA